jgi:hypothetical protein
MHQMWFKTASLIPLDINVLCTKIALERLLAFANALIAS